MVADTNTVSWGWWLSDTPKSAAPPSAVVESLALLTLIAAAAPTLSASAGSSAFTKLNLRLRFSAAPCCTSLVIFMVPSCSA